MSLAEVHRQLLNKWTDRYIGFEAAQIYLDALNQKYPGLPTKLAEGHVSYTYLCYCLDKVKEICTPEEQKEAMDHLFSVHMGNVYDNSGMDNIDFEQTYDHIKLLYEQQNTIANLQKTVYDLQQQVTVPDQTT
jgi:hypothetical protein